MDSYEKGMNPVSMTIINPQKECWASRESNQRPSQVQKTTDSDTCMYFVCNSSNNDLGAKSNDAFFPWYLHFYFGFRI